MHHFLTKILTICTYFLLLAAPLQLFADKNIVYTELGGPSLLYSLNYERELSKNFSARIGIGHADISQEDYKFKLTAVPLLINYIYKNNSNHKFEVGGGVSFWKINAVATSDEWNFNSNTNQMSYIETHTETINSTGFVPMANIGYRYQPNRLPLNFRTGVTLMALHKPWPYMSVGFNF